MQTVSEASIVSGESGPDRSLPNAQVQKRPAGSPLSVMEEKKLRAEQQRDSSSSEDLNRLWPSDPPNEVSFLHLQQRTSSPNEPQEDASAAREAADTCPPEPGPTGIKEEQVSQEIICL